MAASLVSLRGAAETLSHRKQLVLFGDTPEGHRLRSSISSCSAAELSLPQDRAHLCSLGAALAIKGSRDATLVVWGLGSFCVASPGSVSCVSGKGAPAAVGWFGCRWGCFGEVVLASWGAFVIGLET